MNKILKITSYIILITFLFSQIAFADTIYFYHTDPAGTPIAMTDASGSVVWKADYKPFGEEWSITSNIENNKRFVGKEKDTETGLNYFGARYMSSSIGRFISTDPVGPVDPATGKINQTILNDPQRLNLYSYGLNNPYRYIDVLGLTPQDRVRWAISQYKNNKKYWEGSFFGKRNKCNEFVADAHNIGDPDAYDYPTVLRENGYPIPTVSNLGDPNFAPLQLEFLPIEKAEPGDIIVWYGKGTHHSAIYIGNQEVIYQNDKEGVRKRTIKETSNLLSTKIKPIVRRYRYGNNVK